MADFIELVKAYYRKEKELQALEAARAITIQNEGQKIAAKQAEVSVAKKAMFDAL